MIVRMHHPMFFDDIEVKALREKEELGVKWIRVQGKQLKVICRNKYFADHFNSISWYYFSDAQFTEVKHDHITINAYAKENFYPAADLSYVLRVQKYNHVGFPMVSARDAYSAGLINKLMLKAANRVGWMLTIRPSLVRFCKPINREG